MKMLEKVGLLVATLGLGLSMAYPTKASVLPPIHFYYVNNLSYNHNSNNLYKVDWQLHTTPLGGGYIYRKVFITRGYGVIELPACSRQSTVGNSATLKETCNPNYTQFDEVTDYVCVVASKSPITTDQSTWTESECQ